MGIGELSNVTITNLSDNQILKFDASANDGAGQWVNEADGGSGGSGGSTDLTHTRTDSAVTIVSSTGSNVSIPAANAGDTNDPGQGAGIMSKTQATRVARALLDASPALHGNLNISADNSTHHSIVSSNNGDIIFAPNGNGSVGITSGSTLQSAAGGVTNTSFIVEGVDAASSAIEDDHN